MDLSQRIKPNRGDRSLPMGCFTRYPVLLTHGQIKRINHLPRATRESFLEVFWYIKPTKMPCSRGPGFAKHAKRCKNHVGLRGFRLSRFQWVSANMTDKPTTKPESSKTWICSTYRISQARLGSRKVQVTLSKPS